jgi:hypothetical protein
LNINRQSGRRRGRGGGGRSPNNAPNMGNRQDNRQRGNASQLHEKYKAMARDAQLAGDRVQTEYYLQFADHYFRILNENRARFEEQRRQRDDYSSDEDEGEDEAVAQEVADDRSDGRGDRYEREPRQDREPRRDREDRRDREYRADREQRNGERRPRREAEAEDEGAEGDQIALESLPPAIAADGDKAPRRRTRRPRPEAPETDIAPAA